MNNIKYIEKRKQLFLLITIFKLYGFLDFFTMTVIPELPEASMF